MKKKKEKPAARAKLRLKELLLKARARVRRPKATLRAGYIAYSNSFPFLREAERRPIKGVKVIARPPGELNAMLRRGELDVSAISTYEYLENSAHYTLLPDLCINSTGYVRSVLLFSRLPLKELKGQVVLTTPESATSANLLRILFQLKGISPREVRPFASFVETAAASAVLLIGDGALRFEGGGFPYVYDLAQLWTQLTARPVVFAVWAIRGRAGDHDAKLLRKLHRQLIAARARAHEGLDKLAAEAALRFPALRLDFRDYYSRLDYTLHKECIDSIHFYELMLVEMGLLSGRTQISFANL